MKKRTPYIIASIILIIGMVIVSKNENIGSIITVSSIMFLIFYPLIKFAHKKEKETKEHKEKINIIIEEKQLQGINKNLICKKCGSDDVKVQMISEKKGVGCLTVIFYFILAISLIGWLVLIPIILSNKTKTKKYVLCQKCGNSWNI